MIVNTNLLPQWNYWYKAALLNSFFFFLISLLNWAFVRGDLSFSFSLVGAGAYFLLSLFIFLKLVLSGGALAPIAWFTLGSGIFFGGGAVIWARILCGGLTCSIAGGWEIIENISKVNVLNASSSLVVIIVASIQSFQNTNTRLSKYKLEIWDLVKIHKISIFFASLAIVLNIYYFPVAENFIARTIQAKFTLVIPLFLFLTGLKWRELSGLKQVISICLVGAILIIGLLSFSKTSFITPFLVLFSGIWVARRSYRSILIPGALLIVFYALVLVPAIEKGRTDFRYSDVNNSLTERFEILLEPKESMYITDENRFNRTSRRFSHGYIQIYLIEQYNAGNPGESLKDFWVALIPRVLWPDKPVMTRFGGQLHKQYTQARDSRTALAPTYSAEAYWNFGIVGVLVVSILIGLELGWLTNIWFRSMQGKETAYLLIAFPAAYMGFNVEAWVAASYVGGFITLVIIWLSLKFILYIAKPTKLPRSS